MEAGRTVPSMAWRRGFRSPGALPPRWKMAAVTWLGVYPISLTIGLFLAPASALPAPSGEPAHRFRIDRHRLTWVVMPRMTRWFRFWLYPEPERREGRFQQR